jgi:hypothetical protein
LKQLLAEEIDCFSKAVNSMAQQMLTMPILVEGNLQTEIIPQVSNVRGP